MLLSKKQLDVKGSFLCHFHHFPGRNLYFTKVASNHKSSREITGYLTELVEEKNIQLWESKKPKNKEDQWRGFSNRISILNHYL